MTQQTLIEKVRKDQTKARNRPRNEQTNKITEVNKQTFSSKAKTRKKTHSPVRFRKKEEENNLTYKMVSTYLQKE